MAGALIWDFDGTLGYRVGGMWSATLVEIMHAEDPGCPHTVEDVRPHLASGFYWHRHDVPHSEIGDADAWWAGLRPVLAGAFGGLGCDGRQAERLADRVRPLFTDLSRWRLYPHALDVLRELSADGWRHVILSNHVPELRAIARHLGLLAAVEAVLNSAETGYEKPHPRAFELALQVTGGDNPVWMIGDNPIADIAGAGAVGIPGILVGSTVGATPAVHVCTDLVAVARLLASVGRGAS